MAIPKSLVEHYANFPDPRREHATKLHKLIDIIVITLCGTIAKCDSWDEIAEYAEQKQAFLSTFLELPNGIPSHDTIARTFAMLDPKLWTDYFVSWMKQQTKASQEKIEQIQIDGKTLRATKSTGTGKRKTSKLEALEIVSAWASEQQLVIAQVGVEEGSNEIKAVPALLEQLELDGTVVSLDAMGCQKEITDKILKGGGDYLVALKGNQKTLHQAAQDLFSDVKADQGKTQEVPSTHSSFDVAHGRQETRVCYVLKDLTQLEMADCGVENWIGLNSLVVVEATRVCKGKETFETRYFLASADWSAEMALKRVRGHWSIENQEHYVLDMVFHEDANRTRKGYAAQNLAVMRRLSLNLLNLNLQKRTSKRLKRLRALLDDNYLLELLGLSQAVVMG
jgi:predicted transposase YbfD/YdcC